MHLPVSNLQQSIAFYELLGFKITQRIGNQAAFLSSGKYHHIIGLNTWRAPNAQMPKSGQVGLYHAAIRYPNRVKLAKTVRRLLEADHELDGAADHGVSESVYLKDPDGNGLELYADRPEKDWPKDRDGKLRMVTEPLDLDAFFLEAQHDSK